MKKIIIIICTFALCFSLLAIPSFALENDFSGDYKFSDSLVFSPNGGTSPFFTDASIDFYSGGIEYTSMHLTYRGYWVLQYVNDSSSIDVYNSSGWVNSTYKSINIVDFDSSDLDLVNFLSVNNSSISSKSGFYYDIYDIIKTALFDDYEINSAQDMAITLVALVLSIFCVLLPVLILLCAGKRILMSRYI